MKVYSKEQENLNRNIVLSNLLAIYQCWSKQKYSVIVLLEVECKDEDIDDVKMYSHNWINWVKK